MSAWPMFPALRRLLEPALNTLPLPVRGRDARGQAVPTKGVPEEESPLPLERAPKLYLGSMPPTAQAALEAVPFIVAQPLGGYDVDGLHHIQLALRLCIVSEDMEEAENDLQNFISLVRLCLLSLPDALLESRFRLTEEGSGHYAPWERPDEQVWPFLQAHIMTTWQMKGVSHVSV